MSIDLVIVGAGAIGSTLALALRKTKLQVLLIDSRQLLKVDNFSSGSPLGTRVSTLSETTSKILKSLDAWEGLLKRRISPYVSMKIWNTHGLGSLHFSKSNSDNNPLGYIVENSILNKSLMESLRNNSNIQILENSRLKHMYFKDKKWLLTLDDGRILSTPLVIAADGSNSTVRSIAGFQLREWKYIHHSVITNVKCSKTHQRSAQQCFTSSGPIAFLPMQYERNENWCSVVWSTTPEKASNLVSLSDADFCRTLEHSFERRMGKIASSTRRIQVPLYQRHAIKYVGKGIALIGDAAHSIHPLAGQGINLGFLDSIVLADVLIQALKSGEKLSDVRVLSRFERRRMPHNIALMLTVEALQHLFQSNSLAVHILRNTAFKILDKSAITKKILIQQASGLRFQLPFLDLE